MEDSTLKRAVSLASLSSVIPVLGIAIPLLGAYIYLVGALTLQAYFTELGLGSRTIHIDPPDVVAHQGFTLSIAALSVVAVFVRFSQPSGSRNGDRNGNSRMSKVFDVIGPVYLSYYGLFIMAIFVGSAFLATTPAARVHAWAVAVVSAFYVLIDLTLDMRRNPAFFLPPRVGTLVTIFAALTLILSWYPRQSAEAAVDAARQLMTPDGRPLRKVTITSLSDTTSSKVAFVIDGDGEYLFVRDEEGWTFVVDLTKQRIAPADHLESP